MASTISVSRQPARVRARHTKSRRGCTSCKQRHLKCDEGWPTCQRCLQANIKCERLEVLPRRSQRTSGFRAFKMMYCPPRPDDSPALGDLDFFQHRTLPLLRKFQPSVLWDVSALQFMQSASSFRSVAVALAQQQRLVESPETAASIRSKKDAESAYAKAISLVRKSIDAPSGEDHLTLAFECLLLVILESLRGSEPEMIVHLHCGIRIVCESAPQILQSRDMREIGRCLRQYGVSTMLLNPFLAPARQTQDLMWQTSDFDDHQLDTVDLDDLHEVSNEVYEIIVETLRIMYHLSFNDGHLGFEFCGIVARARAKQVRIEPIFNERRRQAEANRNIRSSALWELTEARCLLAKTHLNYAWACDETAFHAEVETFKMAIDLLDSALSRIEKGERDDATMAFSVGLGAISALELVAWRCPEIDIRKQAVELLQRCPRREGVWNADERSRLWHGMIIAEEQTAVEEVRRSHSQVHKPVTSDSYPQLDVVGTVDVF